MNEESLPDWIAAITTAGIIGFVLVLLRGKQADLRVRADDDRRRQASRVFAWLSSDGERRRWVTVTNRSYQPIYQVTVVRNRDGSGPAMSVDFLGPRNTVQVPWDPKPNDDKEPMPVLDFADAAGRWWQRSGDGVLSRAEPEASGGGLFGTLTQRWLG